MTIRELFEASLKSSYTEDLQALIMFLVFEKKVLSMDDDTKELDLYFLEKHNRRMNKELHAYKKKMNIKYGKRVYKLSNDTNTTYVLAHSVDQAKLISSKNGIKFNDVKLCDLGKIMLYNNREVQLKDLIENKEPILGGY